MRQLRRTRGRLGRSFNGTCIYMTAPRFLLEAEKKEETKLSRRRVT